MDVISFLSIRLKNPTLNYCFMIRHKYPSEKKFHFCVNQMCAVTIRTLKLEIKFYQHFKKLRAEGGIRTHASSLGVPRLTESRTNAGLKLLVLTSVYLYLYIHVQVQLLFKTDKLCQARWHSLCLPAHSRSPWWDSQRGQYWCKDLTHQTPRADRVPSRGKLSDLGHSVRLGAWWFECFRIVRMKIGDAHCWFSWRSEKKELGLLSNNKKIILCSKQTTGRIGY